MSQKHLIRKILIANRGEIACRIIHTCREMGIATVAIYSDADAHALHVELADEAVYMGESSATESYLDVEKVIAAIQHTGADAVHPGYGFLSENGDFAEAVINAGAKFIGPMPETIRAMGQKRHAKQILKNVPMLPGYNGDDQTDETLINAALQIGLPVMVKASAGGGGKGLRRVDRVDDLQDAIHAARREAKQAFGDDTLIIEKMIQNPRHIEIQILGDQHGNVIALGERECSIQRRHQKIIEETPSVLMTEALRSKMNHTAVDIGKQLDYCSAGTVEFLVDEAKNYYFMEVNTRLQVEHPVTEVVCNVDLVKLQILVAENHSVLDPNFQFVSTGHAIEARIYAEDPENDFLPAIGKVLKWGMPEIAEVRIDSGIRSGDEVTVHYDPMLAKIIVWSVERDRAIRRMDYALGQLQLLGLKSNIGFLRRVINHPDFIAGDFNTHFIETHPEVLNDPRELSASVLIAAALGQIQRGAQQQSTHWRNNPYRAIRHRFRYGDTDYTVSLTPTRNGFYEVEIGEDTHNVAITYREDQGEMDLTVDGHRQKVTAIYEGTRWWVHVAGQAYQLEWITPLPVSGRDAVTEGTLRAPMPGRVVNVLVEIGQAVQEGALLFTIEAMKMEHRILAPYDGVVSEIYYTVGDAVQAEAVLLSLSQSSEK